MMNSPGAFVCAAFLTIAFVMAGFLQTFWFRSRYSVRFQIPIDGGRTFRGKRIFGANKTWRGFVVMVPGVGVAFVFLRLLSTLLPAGVTNSMWSMSPAQYGLLGCWIGFGFMVAELPNSFVKRQLGISPGAAPEHRLAQPVCFVVDQFDSVVGGLLALAVMVPTPILTWVYILLIGPGFHWAFNLLLFQLGVKARPA